MSIGLSKGARKKDRRIRTSKKESAMNEMNTVEKENQTKPQNTGLALILFILAILYDLSPVDLLPDVMPGVGWVDDLFITLSATLNLIEKSVGNISTTLSMLVRYVKWGVILLGVIAVTLVGFGVYGVVKLITG